MPFVPREMDVMAADMPNRRLQHTRRHLPRLGEHDILIRVSACGVCRTDLHVLDRELPPHRNRVVPGHEIVGRVLELGAKATRFKIGERVGVPWLGQTCGRCAFCREGRENLCDAPRFTGYDRDGGYAQYCAAHENFCFRVPPRYDDAHAAPLMCAGMVGFRTWRLAGGASRKHIGIWGFGAAAHIVCQIAVAHGQLVYAFTRPGDERSQDFARRLGAVWAGSSEELPPEPLDAQLIFAPAGPLVVQALKATRKGGTVVCGGIHMTSIPSFEYQILWGEREVKSVANLTREDGEMFFDLIDRVPVHTHITTYPLLQANDAINALRAGELDGAAVLVN